MDDIFDCGWCLILMVLLAFVVMFGGVGTLVYLSSKKSCEETAIAMQREHTYGLWTNCMIRADDGHLVPLNAFRVVRGDK